MSAEALQGRRPKPAVSQVEAGLLQHPLGAVRELKSGRGLRKGSTLDGTVGSRPRPSLPAPGPGPPRVLHPTLPRGRQADPLGVLQGVGCFEARWGRFLGTAGVYLVRSVSPGARAAVAQVGLLTGRLTQVLSSAGVVHRCARPRGVMQRSHGCPHRPRARGRLVLRSTAQGSWLAKWRESI